MKPAAAIQRVRLTIAFDGAAYAGWQTQRTGIGVQQKIEEALARLFPSRPGVQGSSRTDTGVHALGLVAHFDLPVAEARMAPSKLVLAVNAHLPEDIRVTAAAWVPAGFHARFQARRKQYRYLIWNHPAMNPLLRHCAWHVPRLLDRVAMRAAASHVVGRHDFRALTTNPGYERLSTVREVTRCDVRRNGALITVVIEGDGFLYRMCRGIVGTLVQVGHGRFEPDDVRRMIRGRDRRLAGMTAPAHGLVLWSVHYARRPRRA